MSKWEDTVMSPEQISNIRYEALKEALKATDIASAQCGKERGSGFFGFSGFSDKENREYFEKTYLKEALERIAQAQAEVSFKAGYALGTLDTLEVDVPSAKLAGRKEVVKWIKEENDKNPQVLDGSFIIAKLNPERWQAKLKEWEVE